jgi:acyl-CoA thioesterase FadM
VLTLERQPAFTGEMSIRYEAATPMGSPLEFRARMVERAGRKLVVTSEATDGDGNRVASAHATFIAVDLERIRA